MKDLEAFRQFSTYKESEIKKEEVWSYTRVSSKEQYANRSIENQMSAARTYAELEGYSITNEFGGTYESAKGDFTRKEFTEMIRLVRKAKVKPYAIMIYKLNRFSRSGSGGISVVHELVTDIGVHLIETSTGKSTTTPRGKNEVLEGLVHAEKENLDRLDVTIPGMIQFLEEGNWLGKVPFGYDQYGPRVKDIDKLRKEQKIVLNGNGELLQKAWKWKLQGLRDFQIIKKLDALGLKVSKQKLSAMWRNPFYCGVSVHKLLKGKAVKGKWEKMVSEPDFWKVQRILEGNNVGYKVSKVNENRPLTGFVTCLNCGGKLTSYEVKKKKLHYYTCQNKCAGSSMNANTTPRSKNKGLNDSFKNLLGNYELDKELEGLFRQQLKYSIEAFNEDCEDEGKRLQRDIEVIQSKIDKLEEKHIFEDYPKEKYERFMKPLEEDLRKKKESLGELSNNISNQELVIDSCVDISQNLSKHWVLSDVDTKIRIQELVFPSGVVIDAKKRKYLTKDENSIFKLVREISRDTEGQKKDSLRKNPNESSVVAGTRLELMTFGL